MSLNRSPDSPKPSESESKKISFQIKDFHRKQRSLQISIAHVTFIEPKNYVLFVSSSLFSGKLRTEVSKNTNKPKFSKYTFEPVILSDVDLEERKDTLTIEAFALVLVDGIAKPCQVGELVIDLASRMEHLIQGKCVTQTLALGPPSIRAIATSTPEIDPLDVDAKPLYGKIALRLLLFECFGMTRVTPPPLPLLESDLTLIYVQTAFFAPNSSICLKSGSDKDQKVLNLMPKRSSPLVSVFDDFESIPWSSPLTASIMNQDDNSIMCEWKIDVSQLSALNQYSLNLVSSSESEEGKEEKPSLRLTLEVEPNPNDLITFHKNNPNIVRLVINWHELIGTFDKNIAAVVYLLADEFLHDYERKLRLSHGRWPEYPSLTIPSDSSSSLDLASTALHAGCRLSPFFPISKNQSHPIDFSFDLFVERDKIIFNGKSAHVVVELFQRDVKSDSSNVLKRIDSSNVLSDVKSAETPHFAFWGHATIPLSEALVPEVLAGSTKKFPPAKIVAQLLSLRGATNTLATPRDETTPRVCKIGLSLQLFSSEQCISELISQINSDISVASKHQPAKSPYVRMPSLIEEETEQELKYEEGESPPIPEKEPLVDKKEKPVIETVEPPVQSLQPSISSQASPPKPIIRHSQISPHSRENSPSTPAIVAKKFVVLPDSPIVSIPSTPSLPSASPVISSQKTPSCSITPQISSPITKSNTASIISIPEPIPISLTPEIARNVSIQIDNTDENIQKMLLDRENTIHRLSSDLSNMQAAKDKQIEQYLRLIDDKMEAVRACGEEIVNLRQSVEDYKDENDALQHRLGEADRLLQLADLEDKEHLDRIITLTESEAKALLRRYIVARQTEKSKRCQLQRMGDSLNDSHQQLLNSYAQIQSAHTQQSAVLSSLRKDRSRYKETIQNQERVIQQLERLLSRTMKGGDPSVLLAEERNLDEIRVQVESLELQLSKQYKKFEREKKKLEDDFEKERDDFSERLESAESNLQEEIEKSHTLENQVDSLQISLKALEDQIVVASDTNQPANSSKQLAILREQNGKLQTELHELYKNIAKGSSSSDIERVLRSLLTAQENRNRLLGQQLEKQLKLPASGIPATNVEDSITTLKDLFVSHAHRTKLADAHLRRIQREFLSIIGEDITDDNKIKFLSSVSQSQVDRNKELSEEVESLKLMLKQTLDHFKSIDSSVISNPAALEVFRDHVTGTELRLAVWGQIRSNPNSANGSLNPSRPVSPSVPPSRRRSRRRASKILLTTS